MNQAKNASHDPDCNLTTDFETTANEKRLASNRKPQPETDWLSKNVSLAPH